jgi:cytochrome o ubiquinol oxidase subunit II
MRKGLLIAPMALGLTACAPGVLHPLGPIGEANKTILIDSLAIMLAIVLPTMIAILAFAWWFRASNERAHYLPNWAFSGLIELVVWSIPTMVIILLSGVIWIGSHELDPARPLASELAPLEVQAVSLDWKWLFIYPQQRIATVNQLVVPVDRPLHFSLTSASVMNAFFIPRLGSMIYTMPGMRTQLNLLASAPGEFPGLSSMYSGDGFSNMHFPVRAVPADQFGDWITAARASGPTLDAQTYALLAKPTLSEPPSIYAAADPELFNKIVSGEIPPAPGPGNAEADPAGPRTEP